jgi:hypothetical protein
VLNGADILPDVDGRSIVARRYRDITAQIITDMSGARNAPRHACNFIRRFAAGAVLAERMKAQLAGARRLEGMKQTCLDDERRRAVAVLAENPDGYSQVMR